MDTKVQMKLIARLALSKSPIQYFAALIALAAIYCLSIRFGLLFATASQASPVSPATAFGFAILLIFGMRFWPAVALGALVANLIAGGPIFTVLMITLANTLEALIGAWVYRTIQKKQSVSPLYGNVVATVASSFVGAATSATIGALALTIGGLIAWNSYASVWVTWFAGDCTGGIVFTPILLAFAAPKPEPRPSLIAVLKLVIVSALLLWLVLIRPEGAPFVMLVFPYLVFCAVVAGEWGVLSGASAVYLVGSWSTLQRLGTFANGATNSSLLNLQLLLVGVGITAIVLIDFKKAGQDFLDAAGRILLCGLTIATCGFFFVFEKGKEKNSSQFANIADHVDQAISNQAKLYFTALNSGAGLYSSSKTVSKSAWREFVVQIKPSENLPGLRGLAAVYLVTPGKLSAFIESARNDGAKEFTYYAVANGKLSPREHYIVTYIEPLETNRTALGLDLATEQARKTAADLARDTGEISVTDRMTLAQDNQKRAGFLIFKAIYTNGKTPETIEERRSRLVGWVDAVVVSEDFFSAVLSQNQFRGLTYSITQGEKSEAIIEAVDFKTLPSIDERSIKLKVANQDFTIRVKPSALFKTDGDSLAFWVGLAGVVISLLAAALVASIDSVKRRAMALADEKTALLRASELRHRTLFETSTDAQLTLTAHSWTVSVGNPAMIKLFGARDEADFKSRGPMELSPERQPDGCLSVEKAKLMKETAIRDGSNYFEWTHKDLSGREFPAYVKIVRIEIDQQTQLHVTVQDLTDLMALKKAEAKLIYTSKLASLGEMSAGIAHEINNPLAIIDGTASNLIKFANDPEKLNSKVQTIKMSVVRISKIVSGLKKFSGSGEKTVYANQSISSLLNDISTLVEIKSGRENVALKFETKTNAQIFCNSIEIEQVLINLISNAIDAVKALPEKWVNISTHDDSKSVVLRVTDSGAGIPAKVREKIFDPFFTTKPTGEGTGLGLSISKGILDEHKASISVLASSPNTCFEIRFHKVEIANES